MSWRDDAACRDAEVDMFPDRSRGMKEALAVCAPCPVRVECLRACYDQPLQIDTVNGVWGGTTGRERSNRERAFRIAELGRVARPASDPAPLPRPAHGPQSQHGSQWAYTEHGCRCHLCSEAMRSYWNRRARAKARRLEQAS